MRILASFALLSGLLGLLCGAPLAAAQRPARAASSTPAAPQRGADWTAVVVDTGRGMRMGNPRARVAIVEIVAFGCPACRRFAAESAAPLRRLVARGTVSLELRPYAIHGAGEVAAHILARCAGPTRFFPAADAMLETQDEWMGRLGSLPEAEQQRLSALAPPAMLVEVSRLAGLTALAARQGLPAARANACLASQRYIDREVATMADIRGTVPGFRGTPTFLVNGRMLSGVSSWPALEAAIAPLLR